MIIATITVSGNRTSVDQHYPLTRGLTGAAVTFNCSPEWADLVKTVTWHTREKDVELALVDTGSPVEIPAEMCETAGLEVLVGLTGKDGTGAVKIPTVWASLYQVQRSGAPADHCEPTPGWSDQVEGKVQQAINTAEQALQQVEDNQPLTDRAEAAAAASEASAQRSEAAAGSARQAAANAQAARDTAVKASGAAGSSATAAEQAQAGAETAAQTATEKATATSQSADQARRYETSAGNSAAAASQSAGAADGSAQSASEDAQRAETAAAAAEKSKGSAATSAQTAVTQAGEAATSAGTAANAATAAGKSQKAAAGSAEQAQTDALTASEGAKTATAQADRAKQEADKAAQAAQDAQTIIDDAVISSEKTQSSLKLYDTLCLPFEEKGAVVTCHPVENYPLHVVSEIAVKQEGDGDPSPENVRPIVMQDKVGLTRCGENLVKSFSGSSTSVYNTALFVKAGLKPNTTYFVSFKGHTGNRYYRDEELFTDWKELVVVDGSCKIALKTKSIIPAPGYYGYSIMKNNQANSPHDFSDVQISEYDIPYTPYTGETYTAQLSEPIVGGVVDWSGYATPTYTIYECTGVEDVIDEGPRLAIIGIPRIFSEEITDSYCTHFAKTQVGFGSVIYIQTDLSIDKFKKILTDAYTAGKPVTVAGIALESKPITAAISSAPTALPGVNTLYSDTGDTTVSGRQDPIYTAENLISRVTALENNAVKEI